MSMTWNSENRMTESISQNIYSGAKTLTRYKYDHEGNRVVKSSNYGEVVTPTPEISYRNDSIVTKHIFVSGVRVASKVCDDKSSNTYYQSVDHLGSTNILTDSKGEFYEHIETFPDGSIWVKEYVDQSGVNAVFTCHEMDVETKFFYCKARYYDAQLGRFISVDPIIGSYLPTGDRKRDGNMPGYGGFYNPVNINMYSYGANNPLKFVDPDGKHNEHYSSFNSLFRAKKFLNSRVFVIYDNEKGVIRDPSIEIDSVVGHQHYNMGYSNHQEPGFKSGATNGVERLVGKSILIREGDKVFLIEIEKTASHVRDDHAPDRWIFYTKTEIDENGKKVKGTEGSFKDTYNPESDRAILFNPKKVITGYTFSNPSDGENYKTTQSHPRFVKSLTDQSQQYIKPDDKQDKERYGHK